MHELIASPFMNEFLLVRPGCRNGVNIGRDRYLQLAAAVRSGEPPAWLAPTIDRAWPRLGLTGRPLSDWLLVRPISQYGFARASYELNLGCNYDCPMCYLGVKAFSGLSRDDREKLLRVVADAGVLFLQLTGGEPTVDRLFPDVYGLASDLGMMISVSTNGSRLWHPKVLETLTRCRPYQVTVSVYGATEEVYDGHRPPRFVPRVLPWPGRRLGGRAEPAAERHRRQAERPPAGRHDRPGRDPGRPAYCLREHLTHDLRRPGTAARAVGTAPAAEEGVHRLQRRAHVLPLRPAREGVHLQGRPRRADQPPR